MINEGTMEKIEELQELYEHRWRTELDWTVFPPGITQEKMVVILERIVDTGESILVGWSKIQFPTDG